YSSAPQRDERHLVSEVENECQNGGGEEDAGPVRLVRGGGRKQDYEANEHGQADAEVDQARHRSPSEQTGTLSRRAVRARNHGRRHAPMVPVVGPPMHSRWCRIVRPGSASRTSYWRLANVCMSSRASQGRLSTVGSSHSL